MRRFHQVEVKPFHCRINGQDHERQEAIHQPNNDCALCVEHLQRSINQPDCQQGIVDNPFFPQDHTPRIRANEEVRPKRQDHQEQRESSHEGGFARADVESQRIADEQRNQGGDEGDADGAKQDQSVGVIRREDVPKTSHPSANEPTVPNLLKPS